MNHSFRLLVLLLCLQLVAEEVVGIIRNDFPADFVFGAGTSSYEYEGAVAEDGRTPSIWDTFAHEGRVRDKSTGDVASDSYHKYKEDAKLMSDTGIEAYRFSISWSRILPNGRGAVNPKGLIYYKNVINEIVKHGIQIHLNLHHLDLPQILQDEYGGWLSPNIVDDFKEYADICFKEFGDQVSHWTTIVEPNVYAVGGYDYGIAAPARCSYPFGRTNCSAGNSTTEPYIAVHNMLLAHAEVVNLYRTKYQESQNGQIGMNFYSFWAYPFSNSSRDIAAAQRVFDFQFGWVLNPIVFGDYPNIMKKIVGSKLQNFTTSQSNLLRGSYDFIGLNHYSSAFVSDNSDILKEPLRDFAFDMAAHIASSNSSASTRFDPSRTVLDPAGLQKMLEHLKQNYGDPPLYVEENGYCFGANISTAVNDTARVDALTHYIKAVLEAIRNGVNVKGYFAWSFVDLFEYLSGYKSSCGLYHVDFADELRTRTPKLSARWYSNFLRSDGESVGITLRSDLQHMFRLSH